MHDPGAEQHRRVNADPLAHGTILSAHPLPTVIAPWGQNSWQQKQRMQFAIIDRQTRRRTVLIAPCGTMSLTDAASDACRMIYDRPGGECVLQEPAGPFRQSPLGMFLGRETKIRH